jgi:hypothetical protein
MLELIYHISGAKGQYDRSVEFMLCGLWGIVPDPAKT